jgi:hypothetical protein
MTGKRAATAASRYDGQWQVWAYSVEKLAVISVVAAI